MSKAIRNDTVYDDGLILKADVQNTAPSGTISVVVGAHPRGSTASFASFQVDRSHVVRKVNVMKGAKWPEGVNPSKKENKDVKPLDQPDRELEAIVPELLREAYEGRAGADQSAP